MLGISKKWGVGQIFADDYFVNNARRNYFMPTLDINIEEAKEIFETNFQGALSLIQALAPFTIGAKGTMLIDAGYQVTSTFPRQAS